MKLYCCVVVLLFCSFLFLAGCEGSKKHNAYDVKDPSRITVFTQSGAVVFEKPKGIDLRNHGAQAWITNQEDKELLVLNGTIIVEP